MTSTAHSQVTWQQQSPDQRHRQRPISASDITYVCGALLLSGIRTIPASQRIRVISKVSPFLAQLLYTTNTHPTRTIRENLSTVLGSGRPPDVVPTDIRRLLSMVVWNSLIINSLPVLPQSQIVDLVGVEGISCLDDYLANGYPVLIGSYHFGVDPLIVAALLHARGYPVHVVTHVRQMPATGGILRFPYYLQMQPDSERLSIIDPREGIQRKMLDVLRSKKCLYITPDYMIPEGETQPRSDFVVPVDFLGRKAYLRTGGLRLAKRLGAKVVTVLSIQGENQWRLIVEPFELPTPGLTPVELQHDLQICMRRLEAQVLAHPYLWLDLRRSDLTKRLGELQSTLEKGVEI